MTVAVEINLARMALMLVYVMGVGVFLYSSEWVTAVMLSAVIYWTNISWFYEGKCRVLHGLLTEAKDIIEGKFNYVEPVSGERNE